MERAARCMTRRDAIAATGALALTASATARAHEDRPPNVVVVLVDDLRHDAMTGLGPPWLRTPALDRLRAEGAHLRNAFVTISLCSPSRACFLTGAYAHRCGVFGNDGDELDHERTPTFARVLREAGYTTAYIGKWHQAPRDDPRPGFDHWLSFRGQGEYTDPQLNENGRQFRARGYMTDLLTDAAVRWLAEQRDRSRPFCLFVGHKAVHGPFTPAPRHASLYEGEALPKPASWDDDFAGKPVWQRAAALGGWGVAGARRPGEREAPERVPAPPWDGRARAYLDYYRALQAVDESVGRLLRALEEQGELDRTLFVFTSDNGFFHGEHRRGDKRLAYEEALRIPLLIRYPKRVRPGSQVGQMALSIDLAPTILDYAGVRPPRSVQGRSLRPVLEGRQTSWRRSFLYEYWVDLTPTIPAMLAVRTEDWKYVRYPDIEDLDELYDLRNDPHEMRNLSRDPAHAARREEMRRELDRLLRETGYRGPESVRPRARAGLVLDLVPERKAGGRGALSDRSGRRHPVTAAGPALPPAAPAEGPIRGVRFDGDAGWFTLPATADLDPSASPWVVDVSMTPGSDGVALAHGGASRGYLLGVEAGRPVLVVRSGEPVVVRGQSDVAGRRTHLAAVIDRVTATLYVDGAPAGSARLPAPLGRAPNEGLSIGADAGSLVLPPLSAKRFRGVLHRVRAQRARLTPETVRRMAEEALRTP